MKEYQKYLSEKLNEGGNYHEEVDAIPIYEFLENVVGEDNFWKIFGLQPEDYDSLSDRAEVDFWWQREERSSWHHAPEEFTIESVTVIVGKDNKIDIYSDDFIKKIGMDLKQKEDYQKLINKLVNDEANKRNEY